VTLRKIYLVKLSLALICPVGYSKGVGLHPLHASSNFCAAHVQSWHCQIIGKHEKISPEAFKAEQLEASCSDAVEERENEMNWDPKWPKVCLAAQTLHHSSVPQ